MPDNNGNNTNEQTLEGRRTANLKDSQEGFENPLPEPEKEKTNWWKVKTKVLAYVANLDSLSVIDILEGKEIKRIPLELSPLDVAISPDRRYVYVTYFDNDALGVISTSRNEEVAGVNLNEPPFPGVLPLGVAVSPDGRFIYTTNYESSNLSIIEVSKRGWELIGEIPLTKRPEKIAITPDGRLAYVTLRDDGEIAVVDLLVNLQIKIIPAGTRPIDIAINKNYIGMAANPGSDDVTVFNAKLAESSPTTIPVGDTPPGVAFSPKGKIAYVTNRLGNSVSVIDVFLHKVIDTIPVGREPIGVAVSEGGQFTAVANSVDNSVSIIDNTKGKVIYTVPVGLEPFWLQIATVKR